LDYADNNTYRVRFAEDAISFRFDAYEQNSNEVIFNLSGVGITRAGPKIDATTYIIPLVDNSGSMDGVQSLVTEAIEDLRQILKNAIYEGSQTAVDKYAKSAIGFSSERYLSELSADYRDDISEPKKYLFLVFQNEATTTEPGYPYYYASPRNADLEPTESYLEDFDDFLEAYKSFDSFACLIIVPSATITGYERVMAEHLASAINGIGSYAPLKRYGIAGKYYYPLDATAEDYFALISRFIDF
jgi:hypothetical protein